MWKKEDVPEPATYVRPEAPPTPVRVAPTEPSGARATIGSSITIRGDVTGDEDLLIQGRVEGSVDLKQHSVTVGREGDVKADITGRVIAVEGKVQGNLRADEQVILRSSALVQGDIVAPRVVLEDGARFRGGVDMGETLQPGGQGHAGANKAQSGRTGAGAYETSPRMETSTSAGPEKSTSAGKGDGAAHKPAEVTP